MLKGFKEFILRGNVVELATAVIIGAAFTKIVEAFTGKVLEPLINSIPDGDPTKAAQGIGFCVSDCQFANPNNANPTEALNYIDLSAVITAAINFLIVAAVVYFLIVLPYNKLTDIMTVGKEAEDTEVTLLTEIRNLMDPDAASRAQAEADVEENLTTKFDHELPPPPPAPLAGGEPLIRPSASNPPSGAIPRWEQTSYQTGAQRPVSGGGYPTGSQPPVSGGGAYPGTPAGYPGATPNPGGATPAPGGYTPGDDYQPPPFPGQGPEYPGEYPGGDYPGRHSR